MQLSMILGFTKLLSMKASTPESYKLKKPRFPVITEKTELVDLITPQSFKFFSMFVMKIKL